MWYSFPQLRALGQSSTAKLYGLEDLDDAKAYATHPVLGPQLVDLTRIVLTHPNKSAHEIFGSPDDLKFRSSMTLFTVAEPEHTEFLRALEIFYGAPDRRTLGLLVEPMILASVVVLGGLTLVGVRRAVSFSYGTVALFALFHGYAHGQEMPSTTTMVTFGAGFLLATALLHLTG